MPTWLWILLGVLVGVPLWRLTFRRFIEDEEDINGDLDAEDLIMCMICTTLSFYLIGPRMLLWSAGGALAHGFNLTPSKAARLLGGESRKQRIKRLESEAKARDQRIRELERELL